MANIKKSFNFRHGVQVDDDNFIVNPNGLVGIGSTIPTESLDVLGNVKVRGSLLVDSIQADSIVNASETGSISFNLVNVGITSITSGVISATSGIVTYYGDARYLQGMPTSQWIDVDSGLGYTSIYAAGNVGVATIYPAYTFQVGGNSSLSSFENGVGITSDGSIFIGRDLYVSGIATVNTNLNVTGVTTSYSFSGFGTNITGINASNISNGTLDNARIPSNINKTSGIATFSAFYGNLVGIASTARNLTTDASIDIVSIVSDYSNLGIATASTFNATNSIGIGTNVPNSDFHLRKTSNAKLEVTSDIDEAKIIIGREVDDGILNSFGFLRFGNNDGDQNVESTEESFDIINYAPGNLNYYIRPESTSDLKFNWINYSTDTVLASITALGKLGIGKTNPTETFEVVGTSTVTSNSFVGGDFSVSGNISGDSLSIAGSSTLKSTSINGLVGIFADSPKYTLQIGNDLNSLGIGTGVGISSSGYIIASGIVTASKFVGIGSDITLLTPENIISGTITDVNINSFSGVVTTGILTATTIYGDGLNITSLNPENIISGSFNGNYYTFPNSTLGIGTDNVGLNDLIVKNIGFISGITTIESQAGISTFVDQTYNETFKSIEYTLHVEYPGYIQSNKIMVINNLVGTAYTTYGSISSPSNIIEINVYTVGGFSRLEVTPNAGISGLTTLRYLKQIIYN